MKGVILAAGVGRRLDPLTRPCSKILLPVYDKPMIFYPLQSLIDARVKEIYIIILPMHEIQFKQCLGYGEEFGIKITYILQNRALGTAYALSLLKHHIKSDETFIVINGDNIIEDKLDLSGFSNGAHFFLKEVPDPEKFGVVELEGDQIIDIIEKPESPKSNLIVTGIYAYDATIFPFLDSLQPSSRGEYEITDIHKKYAQEKKASYTVLKGFWTDAGTIKTLYDASLWARNKVN